MELIKRDTVLWTYLTAEIKDLIETGETVVGFVNGHKNDPEISDYSFCVFSFAKAYEGFLKKLLLDMGLIGNHEYYGDDIRIGRILSPFYMHEHGNVFTRICGHPRGNKEISQQLWDAWKKARNLVFHYFPHNFRKLNYDEAFSLIILIIDAMDIAVTSCVPPKKEKTSIIHS